ncbi:hypothetical protein EDB80DRAFT_894734 [Ilyonectria destructans]|nr:hypothetical protein EDB80DRAFT_894734 [Ilyonectria destructans]
MENLPNEILLSVFNIFKIDAAASDGGSMLGSPSDTPYTKEVRQKAASLCSLARVSRRFHEIADPILYDTLIIDRQRAWSLLKSMSRTRRLGKLVNTLHLHRLELEVSEHWVRKLFLSVATHLGLSTTTQYNISEGINGQHVTEVQDAVASFWLALTPNIKAAVFNLPRGPKLISAMFSDAAWEYSALSPERPFPFLEDVRLKMGYVTRTPAHRFHMAAFEDIFQIPTIRSLDVYNLSWTRSVSTGPETFIMPTVSCSIQHLRIEKAEASLDAIENILSRCTLLRTLRLTLGAIPSALLSCNRLGDILRTHGGNLEGLHIGFFDSGGDIGAQPHWLRSGRIGSLQTLRRLKFLSTSPILLTTKCNPVGDGTEHDDLPLTLAEVLPDSIEILHFTHDVWGGQDLETEARVLKQDSRLSRLRDIKLPHDVEDSSGDGCSYYV